MLSHLFVASWPALGLALAIAVLATFVSLGLVRHAHDLPPKDRRRCLAAAAGGLGSAVWSVGLVAQSGIDTSGVTQFSLLGVFAVWLLAVGISAGGLTLATRPPLGLNRVLPGALILGLLVGTLPLLGQLSAGLHPTFELSLPALAAAVLVGEVGAIGACALFLRGSVWLSRWAVPAQTAAACLLGLAASVGDWLLGGAAAAAPTLVGWSPWIELTPDAAMSLAAVGTLTLTLGIEALRRLDARARASMNQARSDLLSSTVRDPLTGLPNRHSFEGTLAQALQQADARSGQMALLYLSLDGMSGVNLSFGHHGGDLVLKEIAKRLRALTKAHLVARLHGDEFLLLMTDDPQSEDATALARRALEAMVRPITLADSETTLTCSVGVALYPQDGAGARLVSNAGVAMREAKRVGGATHAFFDVRLLDEVMDRAELLKDLRLALARRQFELYYQPKVHAPSGQITGVEALLRWNHPARGTISPVVFIPLAERSGLICALGEWVIDQACQQARLWRDAGLRMRVAINLSPVQLRQPDLARKISAALARHHINPQLLTCEITESVALEDTPASRQVFSELAKVGVHISIDDFGSGYSNLSNLRKLPASELKIDRSFVVDLGHSEEARRVVRAVIDLAKALDRQVVAEGVETDAQFQILREMGCDHLQGFLFAKPMTARALGLWAMGDVGPRSIQFRASLFKDTRVMQPA